MSEAVACIGSRAILDIMRPIMNRIGEKLATKYWIRTGAAIGSDQEFTRLVPKKTILYLPWEDYEHNFQTGRYIGCCSPTLKAIDLADKYHPAWDKCSIVVRKLHGRNAHIILGKDLDSPVKFVVFYAEENRNGKISGGTAMGIAIARAFEIPCVNIWNNKNFMLEIDTLMSKSKINKEI